MSEMSLPRFFSLSRPIDRILSFDFFGTKRLRDWTSDLGANGTGMDAQASSRERFKEVLASGDKPVVEGVAEMRPMEGMSGPALGGAGDLESNDSVLRIFIKHLNLTVVK